MCVFFLITLHYNWFEAYHYYITIIIEVRLIIIIITEFFWIFEGATKKKEEGKKSKVCNPISRENRKKDPLKGSTKYVCTPEDQKNIYSFSVIMSDN